MTAYGIIYKKRNGQALDRGEIEFMVSGYAGGRIPDYQMSAFLMACFINGLNDGETLELTAQMRDSGKVLDLSDIPGVKVDKHSTGGVGDGTSLVIAPLVASCGAVVPMMSGRALGHTGGTLDKLESIPGFKTDMTESRFKEQLCRIGVAMIGQTEDIAPADKKMYELRDVTATVDSIPLICASIMSKKLAEGSDALVLDVKTGSGAFMKKEKDARTLAKKMKSIGEKCGKKVNVYITGMHQPLGNAVGNSLEIKQAVDVLKGRGPEDFRLICRQISAKMLVLAKKANSMNEARNLVDRSIGSGSALAKFREMVSMQGGDPEVADNPAGVLPKAGYREDIVSEKGGYLVYTETEKLGLSANILGAGRARKEDGIDHSAGYVLHKKTGDRVSKSEPVATAYFNDKGAYESARKMFISSYVVSTKKPAKKPLMQSEL
ncbi:MAG: thymidine phosphorylase [Endomicrobiales bacterium]|nr:thymidine phosphorylase [Endomicrobiales bacterium]